MFVGIRDGHADGKSVGDELGRFEGTLLGVEDGIMVGCSVGRVDG